MIYRLKGCTKKGKQRIKEHGDRWFVVDRTASSLGEGLIRSVETGDLRWLTKDFSIVEVEE